jgi:hypothetical protein
MRQSICLKRLLFGRMFMFRFSMNYYITNLLERLQSDLIEHVNYSWIDRVSCGF